MWTQTRQRGGDATRWTTGAIDGIIRTKGEGINISRWLPQSDADGGHILAKTGRKEHARTKMAVKSITVWFLVG